MRTDGVLDARSLARLERWRMSRAIFLRADTAEAERALASVLGRTWGRGQIYGKARRILVEKVPTVLPDLAEKLGALAGAVRVSPEDPNQTRWDAIGNLMPLRHACRQVRALWLLDVLQRGRLYAEFQPIFDLRTGEPLGYEGLIRGASPDGTRHLAAEIFPAAHVLGIERAFERTSWMVVLEAAKRLPGESVLFLNVNPSLLTEDADSLSGLGEAVERVEFPYARLALDLVEIERIASLERIETALNVPHDLGVAIALDDVTSGYGVLKYCAGLTPRWIKVDSEITRGVNRDPQRRSILQLLVQVARENHVGLIAEGIESAEDLDVVVAEGVGAAQGYFLARPLEGIAVASPEFREWMANRGGARRLPFDEPAAERAAESAPAREGRSEDEAEL
jgi:EAL domain-containing protein (putative c-di-GMP-specific phosphodiesterase class I)